MANVYLLEQRKNIEVNLEHIDEEMRMEQVRQAASKMSWASFGQAVRRNLLEKRNTIDADGRIDVLKGIAFMRTKMPIEHSSPMEEKVKIMAESLGASYTKTSRGYSITREEELNIDLTVNDDQVTTVVLSLWEASSFYSPEATRLLMNEQWTELRDLVAERLVTYDRDFKRVDRHKCQVAMTMLEDLFKQYSQDRTFTTIHRSNYGFYLPPSDLKQGRVYYMVDPVYRSMRAKNLIFSMSDDDYEALPYFEISFLKRNSVCTLPELNDEGKWDESVDVEATICLKLSKGILVSESTRKKLGMLSAKTVSIRHYTNSYRYLTGDKMISKNLQMITQFTDGNTQHAYNVDATSFHNEGDSVISEVYLQHLQDFHLVIAILRNEAMHMSLWESMLSACYEKQGVQNHAVPAINMDVFLDRKEITISFKTKYAPIKVYIRDSNNFEAKVNLVHGVTEAKIADRIDEILTRKLNETWSIPVMLTYALRGDDCKLTNVRVPLRAENPETKVLSPLRIFKHP